MQPHNSTMCCFTKQRLQSLLTSILSPGINHFLSFSLSVLFYHIPETLSTALMDKKAPPGSPQCKKGSREKACDYGLACFFAHLTAISYCNTVNSHAETSELRGLSLMTADDSLQRHSKPTQDRTRKLMFYSIVL